MTVQADVFNDFTMLVAAAGSGSRLNLGPKAFLTLGDKTLLEYVVDTGLGCVKDIVVAVPEGYIEQARSVLHNRKGVQIVIGGNSRQNTYLKLLDEVKTPYVIIRDVSRPFASKRLIRSVIQAGRTYGASGAFLRCSVPVAIRQENYICQSVPAETACTPSNPQAYRTGLLKGVLKNAEEKQIKTQTLWELLIESQHKIYMVEGEFDNIKITSPRDWEMANQLIANINLE